MNVLQEHGFEIVTDVLGPHAIVSLTTAIDGSAVRRSRAGMRNAMQIEAVRALAWDPKLIRFAREALGDSAFPFRATLFDKSPHSNWLVVWHQDTALPLHERLDLPGWGPWSMKDGVICAHAPASALEQVLAIRVHLDDSTPTNGPLRVLPGTHSRGVLSDDAIHQLAEQNPVVECHVPAGGILLMKPLLVHASSKVQATSQRRVLHIEYAGVKGFPGGLELPTFLP